MMNKPLTVVGLAVFMAAPLLAGSRPAVTPSVEVSALTPQESLERDVRIAQYQVDHPTAGTKLLVVQQEQEKARQDLAVAQARLEAFRTAERSSNGACSNS